jgi:hypothetical protein
LVANYLTEQKKSSKGVTTGAWYLTDESFQHPSLHAGLLMSF